MPAAPTHDTATHTSTEYDLIIIGGGAAGFFTAIQTAEASYGSGRILILEKSRHLLGKVKISGGGRCNVTHSCFDPKALTKHYPRGEKSLIGPFHHFQPQDMVNWLGDLGIELKTEADGRMFPTTDDSQTIIDALRDAADDHGVEVTTQCSVEEIKRRNDSDLFDVVPQEGPVMRAKHIMLATGGTRLAAGAKLAEKLGHNLSPAVPSLFTFNIEDTRLQDLPGVSVQKAIISCPEQKLESTGPLLITHWGLSGPAILKLSAWGAKKLAACEYNFPIFIDWCPDDQLDTIIKQLREKHGIRQVIKRSPLENLPKRLWEVFCTVARIQEHTTWSQLNKEQISALTKQLKSGQYRVDGKSLNKDEFVTCGGVPLKEIKTKTFESKLCSNVFFAGEILDIDGITGGFNFQNAWTTSYLAAQEIAQRILDQS